MKMKRSDISSPEVVTLISEVGSVPVDERYSNVAITALETPTEQWIRIAVDAGDLLVLPAGVYHRFTLDMNDKLSALRLFKVRADIHTFISCGRTARSKATLPELPLLSKVLTFGFFFLSG